MKLELWAAIWTAVGVILAAIVAFIGNRWQLPKLSAEAKKARAEADAHDWTRFQAEIARLEAKIAAQDKKIEAMEKDRRAVAAIAEQREQENRALRNKLSKLEQRLSAIEALFKVHPITPELQAAIDKLDQE